MMSFVAIGTSGFLALGAIASAGDPPRSPTKETYLRRADGICATTDARTERVLADLGVRVNEPLTREQVSTYVAGAVANARRELRALRRLTPPRRDARRLERLYRDAGRALAEVDEDPQLLFEGSDQLTGVQDALVRYGFRVCGSG